MVLSDRRPIMKSKAFVMWTFLCVLLLIDITLRIRENSRPGCEGVSQPTAQIARDVPIRRPFENAHDSDPVPVKALIKGTLNDDCVIDVPCFYSDDVHLRVIIMSFNRENALRKVLESLQKLDTMGDVIALEIWIDRDKSNVVHEGTLNVAQSFQWSKGPFRIHVQSKHAGIYGQWIDTWRPKEGSKELALLVEDDLIISPYTWRWLKAAHAYYGTSGDVMGYSTQSERVNAAAGAAHAINAGTDAAFLYRLIGSWGFAPHPDVWRHFQDWFHKKRSDTTFHPYVDNLVMTSWYKSFEKKGTSDSMWTMWFIYYTNERKLYCVYNNVNRMTSASNRSLAVHREEPGLHYKGKPRADAEKHLLVDWSPSYIDFPKKTKRLSWSGKLE